MTNTIAVVSFKGGAGKSTTTASLAAQFAIDGDKVLAIDMDPQGGLSAALGASSNVTIMNALKAKPPLGECITLAHDVDVITADLNLAGAEMDKRAGWQDALKNSLRRYLDTAAFPPKWVLVDSAPGIGVLPFMALRAARQALIVCPPDFMSVRVIPHVLALCERAETEVMGIIPTLFSSRTRHEQQAAESLGEDYGELLMTEIPRRVAVQDASLAGEPIQIYEPKSDAAIAFADLAEGVKARV